MAQNNDKSECYGWCGKIPKVDFSGPTIKDLDTLAYTDLYLGGRGIATRLYWETVFMNPNVLVPGPGDEVLTRKGMTLDRNIFKEMRREFYELRGWNPETGEQPPLEDQISLFAL